MFPHEIAPIDGELGKELLEQFKGEKKGFVQVGTKKWTLPGKYAEHAEKYYTFKIKPDDLWIMTYPRSGTTWMQELLWLINNGLDYEGAAQKLLEERFPFFEFNMICGDEMLKEVAKLNDNNPKVLEELKGMATPGYVIGDSMKSPRHFKTHLPPSLLPPSLIDTCKVVYVARNALDVAVSFYHHNKLLLLHDFQGDFEKYWEYFEKDLIIYSPYWEHLKEGWEFKDHPNFLFLFYEDLIRDLPSNIKKIAKFLNKQLSDAEIKKLADHVHIDNFRKNVNVKLQSDTVGLVNPNGQNFIRRGKIGGNKEMEGELKIRAEKWFKENLAKTNIKFPEF